MSHHSSAFVSVRTAQRFHAYVTWDESETRVWLLPCAVLQAKQKLYLDRLQLISQRMRRNKVFESTHQVLAGLAADQPRPQVWTTSHEQP